MDETRVRQLLEQVHAGTTGVEAALQALSSLPFEDLGFAKLDLHRSLRRGFPEVILAEGKTASQVVEIAQHLAAQHAVVLATRVLPAVADALRAAIPGVMLHPEARLAVVLQAGYQPAQHGDVLVVSGGTSDQPVAEECALTATYMGNRTERLYDVGVSGLPRLLAHVSRLRSARVIVVVAGMDAALAAVVAGLVEAPVIAVPTSTGYGTAFGGVAPLLTMLNSCSSGVGVVNIDNGFGAAHLASLINHLGGDERAGTEHSLPL